MTVANVPISLRATFSVCTFTIYTTVREVTVRNGLRCTIPFQRGANPALGREAARLEADLAYMMRSRPGGDYIVRPCGDHHKEARRFRERAGHSDSEKWPYSNWENSGRRGWSLFGSNFPVEETAGYY